MARKTSIILTPAETKQAVTLAKGEVKTARGQATKIEQDFKAETKQFNAKMKELDGERNTLVKEFAKAEKAYRRELSTVNNYTQRLSQKLNELAPPKAVASPTGEIDVRAALRSTLS